MKDRRLVRLARSFPSTPLDRRALLRRLALGAAAVPLFHLACGEGEDDDQAGDAGVASDGGVGADAGTSADAGLSSGWATGGTTAMVAKASYGDPFTESLSDCALVATTTLGPCTTEDDQLREDVSEGWTGLPVRLALKLVDTQCNPLSGASVKIWHTNLAGSYSGETPNNNMCLADQSYSSTDFFRGVQSTAADGTVYFDTCFPGWYRGRAVHIHFQVKTNGVSQRVSQLFFPEDVTQDVFAHHAEYAGYGQPDTTFSNDNIIGAIATAQRARHVLAVERMSDGVMLASKVVTVV